MELLEILTTPGDAAAAMIPLKIDNAPDEEKVMLLAATWLPIAFPVIFPQLKLPTARCIHACDAFIEVVEMEIF